MQKELIQKSKFKNQKLRMLYARDGQSLAEVMIGLAIGAILIGAAAFAITTMLKTNLSAQKSQFAASIAQEILEQGRSYASADWQNINTLQKGSSTTYFFVSSSTTYLVVQGKEGVLDNEIKSGLIGKWGFDESTGTIAYDGSGNGNNGILSGTISRATSTCKVGLCVSATGTSATANVGSPSIFDSPSFSFSMWINPKVINSGDQYNNIILGRESYLTSGFRFGIRNSGKLLFWTSQSGGSIGLESSIALQTNVFSNIVLTYSSSTANMYINGQPAGSATGTLVIPTGVQMVINGGVGGTQSSNTIIDDVRMYNRVLSIDEVKQLYGSGAFTRYFYIESTCRTTDASSTVSGVAPCGGGSVDDPSTQKISAVSEWGSGLGAGKITLSDFLTRWKNAIFQQTDWSGGGTGGVVTDPGNTFSSSSNVNYGGGSIRINGL